MIPLSRPILGTDEEEAVVRVLRSGRLAQGPEVEAFEEEFSQYVGVGSDWQGEAVAVANGTAALELALMGLGVGPGDEVIVPTLTFVATANAVRAVGATPVLVDVRESDFNIDPEAVTAAIGPKTAAVIAVHLYGHPADIDTLLATCTSRGIALVEDSAQAHGAAINGRRVGSFGTGTFSFYPTKNMTTGEGGIVTTSERALARRMRLIRNHGMLQQYAHETYGLNLRLNEMGAAIGRVQLRRLDGWNDARRTNAAWYDANLRGVVTPMVGPGVTHAYHQYTIRSTERDAMLERFSVAGIGAGVYYPSPLHRIPPYATVASLPVAEQLTAEILSLPVRPDLTADERDQVAAVINR